LRISERRLGEAQQLASLGSWILDAETGALQCSDEARRIFGFDIDGSEPTVRELMARIPEEEREGIERAVETAKQSHERVEFEHRLLLADGRERWVHTIVQLSEEDGKTALRGTVRDDTQRQKGALRLKLEHDIARLLVGEGDTELVMARALAAICSQMDWDIGACWVVGADGLARCGPVWHVGASRALDQFVRVSSALTYRSDEGSRLGQRRARVHRHLDQRA